MTDDQRQPWDHEHITLWNAWLATPDGRDYQAGWGDHENRERARRGESWVAGRVAERRAVEAEVARLKAEDHRVLDPISHLLECLAALGITDVYRGFGCVEFRDESGRRLEVVVREIDADADEKAPRGPESPRGLP